MKPSDEFVASLFASMAHPNRVRIVEMLRHGELCQCVFPEALGIEQSNLSRHIKILTSAGVLASRRDGVKIMLSIADNRIIDFIDAMKEVLHARLMEQASGMEQSA